MNRMSDPVSSRPSIKRMNLRRPDRCGCGRDLPAGTYAGWDHAAKVAICLPCVDTPDQPSLAVPDQQPFTAVALVEPAAHEPTGVDVGVAGASLHREYARRVAKRDERVRAAHPRIGGLILALTDEPQTTTAFKAGAIGEQRAATRITDRCGDRVLFLLNRKLGRDRRDGDIDLIAINAHGVYVIDVKRYKDAKVEVRRSGGLFRPVSEQLFIRGRDSTKLLDSLAKQLAAVRRALALYPGGSSIPAETSLCFVDAELPLFGKLQIGGIPLLGPKGTTKMLTTATGRLDEVGRSAIHVHLAGLLPPAD